MKIKFSTLVLSAVFLGCSFTEPTIKSDQEIALTILHTNDHHGRFWKNEKGEYGMAARKTLIERIKNEVKTAGGEVLLFSGGDINTGVFESDMQDAKPDFIGMNALKYDAMAVGNHEFDNPLSTLKQQEKWANFPFLAANIYDKKTNKRLFKPYIFFNKSGLKIAVVGLTTEDTLNLVNPENVKDVVFTKPSNELLKLLPEIKAKNPHLIFAITHMGHYENAKHGNNAPGDVSLARKMPKGDLHMIIGGHSQNPVCMNEKGNYDKNFAPGKTCRPDTQNGTYIVQAHEWGKYVGRADFTYKNGEFKLKNYALIPVNLVKKELKDGKKVYTTIGEKIAEDEKMLKLLTPYKKKFEDQLSFVIGKTNGKLNGDREIVRNNQTNLGNLITTAMAKKVKADFGILNSGGIRDSIEKGNITYKSIVKVQPFNNNIVKVEMRGDKLIKYLGVVANKEKNSGGYAQFSSNISMKVSKKGVENVMINGKKVQKDKLYSFAILKFMAIGGDKYPIVDEYIDTGFIDASALKEYIEANPTIDAKSFENKGNIIYK